MGRTFSSCSACRCVRRPRRARARPRRARAPSRPLTAPGADTRAQGLYHDLDGDPLAFNFAMAENRDLCFLGSAGVLGLQLLMPLFLSLDAALPSRGVLHAAFWLAMSFHAGNHILWRINFFVRAGRAPCAHRPLGTAPGSF